jgi:hypothetical protein
MSVEWKPNSSWGKIVDEAGGELIQAEAPTQPNFMSNLLRIIKFFYFVRKHLAGANLVKTFFAYMWT